ncbi:TPA: hypothetical protein N0F65_005205 [Lagenidium giganteum]|uniref:Transmembrane protein n=1 Tax=Lagenidium giganteum TaxID=4803 RepID=A0AAV2Z0V5_9STRA|nr:TPA: hypothetical protein N0F65_005205 [Lagenidium giganteum]
MSDECLEGLACTYEFAPSGVLPTVDPSLTIKQWLLSASAFNRYNAFLHKYNRPITVIGHTGSILSAAVIVGPASFGRVAAIVQPFCSFIGAPSIILSLRVNLLRLVLSTFDFWYGSITDTVCCVCYAILFQDVRIAIMPLTWLGYVFSMCVDANLRDANETMGNAIANAGCMMFLGLACALQIIDDAHQLVLFSSWKRSLSTKEVLLNGLGILLIWMVRTAVRKRQCIERRKQTQQCTNQMISYRCKLILLVREGGIQSSVNAVRGGRGKVLSPVTSKASPKQVQLKHIPIPVTIKATRLICRRLFLGFEFIRTRFSRTWGRVLCLSILYGVGLVGITTTVLVTLRLRDPELPNWLVITSISTTIAFFFVIAGLCQTNILLRLSSSFDAVFLSLQLQLAIICVCDLFNWDWRATCAVLSSYFWLQLVLVLDALTPVMRHQLAFDLRYATIVLVLAALGQVALTLELMVWDNWELQDRVLVDREVFGRPMVFRVVPFLFSRMLTVFLWCMRLVWRMWTRDHPSELILLLGNVEYVYKSNRGQQRPYQWRRQTTVTRRRWKVWTKVTQTTLRATRIEPTPVVVDTGEERTPNTKQSSKSMRW